MCRLPSTLQVLPTQTHSPTTAYAQGRYVLAEHAWRKAYQAKASDPAIGPHHPDTLTSRSNLAYVLYELGRLEEAETENRAVLDAMTRVLGPDHPDTLTSRSNLANILRDLGRLEEAEAEYRAVLDAMTRVLGPDHPDTLISRSNLAIVLYEQGRLEEAEAEYRAVLERHDPRARPRPPRHPDQPQHPRQRPARPGAARGSRARIPRHGSRPFGNHPSETYIVVLITQTASVPAAYPIG